MAKTAALRTHSVFSNHTASHVAIKVENVSIPGPTRSEVLEGPAIVVYDRGLAGPEGRMIFAASETELREVLQGLMDQLDAL